MPTNPRSFAVRLLLVLAAIGSVGACGLLPPGIVPAALSPVLVTYETAGGECPQGPCGFKAEIHGDGRVTRSDGLEQVLEPEQLERLVEVVRSADWEAVLATPFEGECPRNFDGQEETYTFHVDPEPVVVASCTTLVDPEQEPFRTVRESLFAIGG